MAAAEPLPAELERALSLTREAGSPGAAEARELLRALLIRLGYDVEVQRFAFSPRSLNAFPVAGAGLGLPGAATGLVGDRQVGASAVLAALA